jgi:DNA-binding NarL/FixJ family response regulator
MTRSQARQRELHREPEAGDGGHREGQPPTPRQLEVFQTVARSRSRADAADALGITEQSIKNQFSHLFRRLGVGGELQAAWVLWGRRRKAKR